MTRSNWPSSSFDRADAIVDLEPLGDRMLARDRDHFGRRVDARNLRAQPRQRLRQQPRAATDVERGLALERPPAALVDLPMLVDPVADIFEAHRD